MYALLRLIMKTYRKYHFHVWKTLVVNFKLLPFKQAIHLPIVIYGKTQLIISNSSVKLLCSPRFGIVKFAKNHEYFYPTPAPSLLFMINGTMVLEGDVQFSSGCTLRINDGILQLGENVCFSGGCKILCNNRIFIRAYSQFAFDCVCCDTNFHYILQKDGLVKDCVGIIEVGNRNWIGNYTTHMRGTQLPDNTIVASRSFVNKSFLGYHDDGILIAGSPGKVVRLGDQRVFSAQKEMEIRAFFKKSKMTEMWLAESDFFFYE